LDHLKEHCDLSNSQLNCFDEINTLADQLMVLNIEINNKSHKKLDKWRDDCLTMINHYYEEKYQELQQRYMERVQKYGKEIERIKERVNHLIREEEATHEDIPTLKASTNNMKRDIK
jgi:predicted RNase H-like nuclease (RuvC/YqgF family)